MKYVIEMITIYILALVGLIAIGEAAMRVAMGWPWWAL
jgi:hypothetical protein